jgi:hypothetical protein
MLMPSSLSSIKTYTALPFTLLFGILPLYHAQMCHIWSNRLTVSSSAGRPFALSSRLTFLVSSTKSRPSPLHPRGPHATHLSPWRT